MSNLLKLFILFLLVPLHLSAQDLTQLGGDLTTTITGHNGLQVAAPNVDDEIRRIKQLEGFQDFHRIHTKKSGLGVKVEGKKGRRFAHKGCAGCHVQNGKGRVRLTRGQKRKDGMVVKVSLRGLQDSGAPINVPGIGEQLQRHNTNRNIKKKHRLRLRWTSAGLKGTYPDGTKYRLRRPLLTFRIKGYARSEIISSLRMTPGLNGLGLLEAIPEHVILSWSDPEDSNNDGISGVPQYTPDRVNGGLGLGRFGFKASNPTLAQQTGAASFFDMGVTNPLFTVEGEEIETSEENFEKLVIYQALAGVPIARNQDNLKVIRGKELFQTLGCDDCHKMTVTTEDSENPELDGQTIHPFTDLLMHDMGDGLADERAEFSASGREWKTTPLWGIGFFETVSHVKQNYLHDGRARTIEEAILWHGGEAEAAQDAFKNLSKADRKALIKFLKSL